jgi:glycosyltransferase involved in cell wall biosynthesis
MTATAEGAGPKPEQLAPSARSLSGAGADGRIRVLLAIKGLATGGAERLLVDTVATGDAASFDYEVACVMADLNNLAPRLADLGIPVHQLGATGNLDVRWVPRFRRLLVEGRFDIVHFHLPYTAAIGRPIVLSLPSRSRPMTLYTEHCLWNKVSPPIKMLNRLTVGTDRLVLAVSEASRGSLPDRLRQRARVVVHGIDQSLAPEVVAERPTIRRRIREQLDVPEKDLLALTVAGLRAEKGYDLLLEAAHLAVGRNLPIRFAAAGDGALAGELRSRHEALGLGESFRFLGHRTDILELMAAADVVVLPSHQDGLPVVVMEATSIGTPIVATAQGGLPQAIEDGVNGLLVPPRDPEALADALGRLAADPHLLAELGQGALERRAAFDVARSTAEIEDLYRSLVVARR